MSPPKLHIEPMMRQRLEDCDVLLSEVAVLTQERADVAREKIAGTLAALDSQPEQGGEELFSDIDAFEKAASNVVDEPFDGVGVRAWSELLLALSAAGWQFIHASDPSCPSRQDQEGGEGWPEVWIADAVEGKRRGFDLPDRLVLCVKEPPSDCGMPVRRYVPAPASPKADLERLMGVLDQVGALLAENRQAAAEQVAHRESQPLREEAEGLPKSKLEEWCERAKAEGKFDSEYEAFLAAFAHEFSVPGEAEGLGEDDPIRPAVAELYERASRCKLAGDPQEFVYRRLADDLATLPPESQEGER